MLVLSLTAGLTLGPGTEASVTSTGPDGVVQSIVFGPTSFDDTTVNLGGTWGVAVNMGNFDADPRLEVICRLSEPGQQNTLINRAFALDDNLAELWHAKWGYIGNAEVSSATLADLDGDDRDEILLPFTETFFEVGPAYKCRIYALDGLTGAVEPGWPFIFPGWPESAYHNVYSELVAADINNDDTVEILANTSDMNSIRKGGGGLYCLNATGRLLWRYFLYPDTVDRHGAWNSPAVADLDGDGRLEVIVHTGWFMGNNPWALKERRLFIFNDDGTVRRQWQTEGAGSSFTPDYASPVIADINGDNRYEIVILRRPGFLDVYDTAGTMLPGFPVNLTADAGYISPTFTRCFSTPSVADLDGDDRLEIVCGSFGLQASPGDWAGRVHIFNHDGSRLTGFPFVTRNGVWHSPGIGNVDANPGFEILTSAVDSAFYVLTASGDTVPGLQRRHFPTYFIPDQGSHGFVEGKIPLSKTPFLHDVDGDSLTDILMEGSDGYLYVWNSGAAYDPEELPWSTFQLDKMRTGCLRNVILSVADQPSTAATRATRRLGSSIQRPGLVRLNPSDASSSGGVVTMYDRNGRLVRQLSVGLEKTGGRGLVLDATGLPAGVYFVCSPRVSRPEQLVLIE